MRRPSGAPAHGTAAHVAAAPATPAGNATIPVETVVQTADGLVRQALRMPAGATLGEALRRAGHADAVAAIADGRLGLSRFGRRAWLDDPLGDASGDTSNETSGEAPGDAGGSSIPVRAVDWVRIEVLLPIGADAKALRRARAAAAQPVRRRGARGAS